MMKNKSELLYERLKVEILSGMYPAGTQLPRESEFARQNQVALMTLRAALARLEADHLIARLPRSGTFVLNRETPPNRLIQLRIADYSGKWQADRQFIRDLVLGAANAAYLEGYQLEIRDALDEPRKLKQCYQQGQFSGIVWDRPPAELHEELQAMRELHIPQLTINRKVPGIRQLSCDYPGAIRKAMRFLRSIGHRHVALVDIEQPKAALAERKQTFLDELRFAGLPDPQRYLWEQPFPAAPDAWIQLAECFRRCPETTAVIVYYTHWEALRHYLDAAQRGVPGALSIVVWGDLPPDDEINTDFDRLPESRFEIGARAVRRLIENPDSGGADEIVTPELIIRGSCGLPAGQQLISR